MWKSAPWPVRLWLAWSFLLLAGTGLLLPQIIAFTDFSERAPFSPLGIFMMLELAALPIGITVVMHRRRIGLRLAIGLAALTVTLAAGLRPALFRMPAEGRQRLVHARAGRAADDCRPHRRAPAPFLVRQVHRGLSPPGGCLY